MIYTVTCNPSLDYSMELDTFHAGTVHRVSQTTLSAGGKGLNVSTVLHRLHMETTALGFAAGFVGTEILRKMSELGVLCRFCILPEGCSRINVKLRTSDTTQDSTELNANGPAIPAAAQEALTAQLSTIEDGDTLVLAGSIPSDMAPSTYADWLAMLSEKQLTVVVDAVGKVLLDTLPYHPFLIKPNHHELGELFGVTIQSPAEAASYAAILQGMGARNVLVSMSGEGAVLRTETGISYYQKAAQGTVRNDVGAGDSMIAGFLASWLKNGDYPKALHEGTAAGAATAFSTGLATQTDIETIGQSLDEPQQLD